MLHVFIARLLSSSSSSSIISTSGWIKGISLSILSSIFGGASKLAIRKSWLMVEQYQQQQRQRGEVGEGEHGTVVQQDESSNIGTISSSSDHNNGQYSHIIDADDDEDASDNMGNSIPLRTAIHLDRNRVPPHYWLPILLRGIGMIGMTTLNPLCSVLAMNYASPSILAPFAGLTLVWIVLFSQPLIGEQPSTKQVVAASLIVLGEIIIAIFGDHTNDDHVSIHDVILSYRKTDFIFFIVSMCTWMLVLFYCMFNNRKTASSTYMQRFAWGVAGGSITGFQNFLKDSLTILKAHKNENQDDNQFPYALFIGMFSMAIITALSGLLILMYCMKRYDVTYSASMFVGSFCISASIMSAIHYNTFQNLSGVINYIGYPVGLLILLFGVYLLLVSKSSTSSIIRQPLTSADTTRIMNATTNGIVAVRPLTTHEQIVSPLFLDGQVENTSIAEETGNGKTHDGNTDAVVII